MVKIFYDIIERLGDSSYPPVHMFNILVGVVSCYLLNCHLSTYKYLVETINIEAVVEVQPVFIIGRYIHLQLVMYLLSFFQFLIIT